MTSSTWKVWVNTHNKVMITHLFINTYRSWVQDGSDEESTFSSIDSDDAILDPQNFSWNLHAVVAYYGMHYFSFIKHKSWWYIWDDSKIKSLNQMSIGDYFEKHKLIPYLVFYNVDRLNEIVSRPTIYSSSNIADEIDNINDFGSLDSLDSGKLLLYNTTLTSFPP